MTKSPILTESKESLDADKTFFMPLIIEASNKIEQLLPEELKRAIESNTWQLRKGEQLFNSIISVSRNITIIQHQLLTEFLEERKKVPRAILATPIKENLQELPSDVNRYHQTFSRINAHLSVIHRGMEQVFRQLQQLSVELERNSFAVPPLVLLPKILDSLKFLERSSNDLINDHKRRLAGAKTNKDKADKKRTETEKIYPQLTGTEAEKDKFLANHLSHLFGEDISPATARRYKPPK